jgi:hypothetical protein
MAITVKHTKVSTIPDGDDSSLIRPSDWNADHQLVGTIPVANGGTGASTLTGYVKGNGTSTMTASSTIPNTDITGLGTASTKDAGVANGVATLDSAGKVPVSQIPALGDLNYQGTWNATTNTPTLTSSVGTKGYYYVVSVAGTTNLNGITDWQIGDWAVYNGTAWQKIDNTDAVTSVNGYTGTVVLTQSDISGTVPTSRTISTGTGLTGGGDLSANRTISFSTAAVGTWAATPSSANLASAMTDETGSGSLVFGTSPTISSPTISGGSINGANIGGVVAGDGAFDVLTGNVSRLNTATATSLTIGTLSYTPANALISSQSSVSTYNQVILQNSNTGATASADFIVNNSNSTDSTYYGDFGMNSSGFTGTGAFNQPNTVYLTGTTADLAIGTTTSNSIHFVVAGGATDAMTINTTKSIAFNGSYGTAGQVLTSGGSTGVPTWTTPTTGTVTSVSATSPVVSSGGNTPTISMPAATTSVSGYLTSTDWNTFNGKGSGSVTSVAQSFTGGLISVAGSPITTSGTLALTVAGTSGGIPYFASGTTWASSAVLASNALMVGGGAGVAPSTITTGTGVTTALGVNTGSSGAFVVNGGALGTPSSGTVTNLTGTASININGTVGATTPAAGTFTSVTLSGTSSNLNGDFSNATVLSRSAFKTTTTNGSTGIYALPNGTSTAASWQASNAADPTNASKILIATNGSTDVQLVSGINGTGTYLPMTFYNNGAEKMRLSVAGGLAIGSATDAGAGNLLVQNTITATKYVGVSGGTF